MNIFLVVVAAVVALALQQNSRHFELHDSHPSHTIPRQAFLGSPFFCHQLFLNKQKSHRMAVKELPGQSYNKRMWPVH